MKSSIIEKIKTITLIILVISSMMLTYRLWFKDHNLFDIIGVFKNNEKTITNENTLEYIYSPTKILFNFGREAHDNILAVDNVYKPLQNEGLQILKGILLSQVTETIDISKWNEFLSSKSLLFGYDTSISTEVLAKFLKVEKLQNKISSIQEFIVVRDSAVSDNLKCYIKDEENKNIYVVKFNYNDNILKDLITKVETNYSHNYVTAYEMKYNTFKDDVLLLPIEEILYGKKLKLTNEYNLQSESDIKNIAGHFFKKYHIVKNIEYMNDAKNKVIKKEFIDKSNILRLYDNGTIEYTTTDIPNTSSDVGMTISLETAVRFVESNLGFPPNSYISEIKKVSNSHYVFGFDYLVNGLKIKNNGENIPEHAIEVEVKGNIVSSYIRLVKEYKIDREQELKVTNIKAIDKAIEGYRKSQNNKGNENIVNQVELVYVNNEYATESYPYWFIKIQNNNYYINSINEEF